MPPKKKKPAINPVVVGTVSTRSTQRQSIVNIDIPKLSRPSPKSNPKTPTTEPAEDEVIENFPDKVKQSYQKMFEKIMEPPLPVADESGVDAAQEDSTKSNEALIQILEDWTDEESQEGKKQQAIAVKNERNTSAASSLTSNTGKVTELLVDQCEVSMQVDVDASSQSEDSKLGGTESGREVVQDFVMEENESVHIEEHVEEVVAFDEENVVECVTEEIITEDNEQFLIIENAEATSSPCEERAQEAVDGLIQPEVAVVRALEEEMITENSVVEETDLSLSTTDSNDAEVRGFFAKEIENNETVNEEDIPSVEGKEDSNIENVESENVSYQESLEIDTVRGKESEMELNSAQCEPEEVVTKSVEECESVQAGVGKVEHADEPMDLTVADMGEETIESRVAQMHLMDDDIKQEDANVILKADRSELADFSYSLENSIEDILSMKPSEQSTSEENKAEDDYELYKSKTEFLQNVELVDKPKARKVKAVDTKPMSKQVEELLAVKTVKPKEKKPAKSKPKEPKPPKEPRSRKKSASSTSKKTKDKAEKKEAGKAEKKESAKKSAKTESEITRKLLSIAGIDLEDMEVRRSSRIKSISVRKKKTTGHGLVRSKSESTLNESDVSDSNSTYTESGRSTPSASPKVQSKEKKSRWSKSSETLSCDSLSTVDSIKSESQFLEVPAAMEVEEKAKLPVRDPIVTARLKQFVHLKENSYKTDRMTCKEAKKMMCDCFLTTEEIEANEFGCGEDCLNRLLLIECGSLCQVGDRCTNKRFQKAQFAPVEVFNTEKKGLGLRAAANIPYGEFILEYVGEVLNSEEFDKRAEVYSQDKNIHYYFMSLRADAIIDATSKGNISRFINHSCDPNAETQKWTVNGELRIGFFSTRTILAGEEITFDYRFQRYGKEAQKCYCEAAICRGWLGEQPDEDSEDEDEEEEEEEMEQGEATVKTELPVSDADKTSSMDVEMKVEPGAGEGATADVKIEKTDGEARATPATPKKKTSRKKPRKELFEDVDLDEEIEMLVTTGLKNQAHTLKLSRLMVRAKEPAQRTKLLRILRRGELPCRRLFLDYHGLRLMHGYMIDAQHLVHTDKKYESLRLEVLQTLAVLPIPNKTMLQDSKVLPTVEKWASGKDLGSPQDSDSNSPKLEVPQTQVEETSNDQVKNPLELKKEDERSVEDQEEEIRFLASKLLEGWANLKEVFRIPKKERIEQMKEHEREANKKFMQGGYANEPDSSRKGDRYRQFTTRIKFDAREPIRKGFQCEKPSAEFIRLSKIERRKLFALQHELKEEERRMKQREMWRQHEVNCMMIGADPRFTAPFDPSRGYQYVWNPQMGQWQTYPLSTQHQVMYAAQAATPAMGQIPNLSMPPPQMQPAKPVASYPYAQQIPVPAMAMTAQTQMHLSQVQGMGIPGALPQIPTSIPAQPPLPQYADQVKQEEDPSQVKFMGPIPPPAKLPPKWKCAKDKYGRPYYYHVKIRKSQWEPPPLIDPADDLDDSSETESSSDTSTISSDSSSENSDSDDDVDDTRLLMEVRKQMEKSTKVAVAVKTVVPEHIKTEETPTFSPDDEKMSEEEIELDEEIGTSFLDEDTERPSIDIRLKEQFNLLKDENPPKKKRRLGLCEEIIISPRTEEDRLQFKEDLKRYKANKEKLKRQKELILQQTKKQLRESDTIKKKIKLKSTLKTRIKEMPDFNSEQAKKIKENFRANMASTVVGSLNAYRKPDCKEGKITNTEDFKHLARKLTHFVMLKEMKHIDKIEDLTCTDNVKSKAREYIRKYMSKFGEVYIKRNDSPDFKD